jgi:hypothetical protein
MSHQPFESYLLAEAKLSHEQQSSLNLHLKDCERCLPLSQALTELDSVLEHSTAPLPAPGFTQRWQTRLAAHQQTRQIRQFWLLAVGMLALAVLIISAMFLVNIYQINWSYEFTQAIARLSVFTAQIRQFTKLVGTFTDISPIFLPMAAMFGAGIFSFILLLIITWFGTIIKLYSPVYEKGNQS